MTQDQALPIYGAHQRPLWEMVGLSAFSGQNQVRDSLRVPYAQARIAIPSSALLKPLLPLGGTGNHAIGPIRTHLAGDQAL